MRAVKASGPVWPLPATTALVAVTPVLAARDIGGDGAGAPLPYVAEFALGAGTAEGQQFVLTPTPGPQIQVLPEPSPAPSITPSPDLGEQQPTEPMQTLPVTPTPDPGGWPSFEPSATWVNDGQYLGVITFGSGSCPSGPYGIEVVADQEIEIRLGPLFPDRNVCSADIAGHVTVVKLPHGITPTKPLVARFDGGPVTLPAIAGR
jgi:hypothetical protein